METVKEENDSGFVPVIKKKKKRKKKKSEDAESKKKKVKKKKKKINENEAEGTHYSKKSSRHKKKIKKRSKKDHKRRRFKDRKFEPGQRALMEGRTNRPQRVGSRAGGSVAGEAKGSRPAKDEPAVVPYKFEQPELLESSDDSEVVDNEDPEFKPISLDPFEDDYQDSSIGHLFNPASTFHDGLNNPLLIQLPSVLPFQCFDNLKTEDKGMSKSILDSTISDFSVDNALTSNEINSGRFGELVIYDSGRVQIQIGDFVMDVERGCESRCAEELIQIDLDNQECNFVGTVDSNSHLLCTYNIDDLLKSSTVVEN